MRHLIAAPALILGLVASASSQAAELAFEDAQFVYKATENITQTYASQGANKHDCVLSVTPKKGSTVAGVLNVDKAVMRPPVTLAPLEIVTNSTGQYKDDAASLILLRHNTDSDKFKVVLHRATLVSDGLVRDVQVACSLKFEGLFSKNTEAFDRVKAAWVKSLFLLDPEIVAASP